MGRFYKASSGRILCIELQQIAFLDEWKDQNPNDKKED